MKILIFFLLAVFCVGGTFCLAGIVRPEHKYADLLYDIPTPADNGLCYKCELQPYCTPRMQCWEAYREAVREIMF